MARPTTEPRPGGIGCCSMNALFGRKPVIGDLPEHVAILARYADHVGLAEPRCRFPKGIENRLQVKGRAADNLEHVGGGSLLLQRLAQFVEQPGVLDGDNRLACKTLNQLDLFVGEEADLLAVDDYEANHLLVL